MLERISDGYYFNHPERFVPETTDWKYRPWQEEALLKLLNGKNRTLQTACERANGGTTFSVLLAYHFLLNNIPSKVLYVSPFWGNFYYYAKPIISTSLVSDDFLITKTAIKSKWNPDNWFALALSGNCEAKRFEGFCGPDGGRNLLVIIDNAESVKNDVIETLRESLSHDNNLLYMNFSGQRMSWTS